MEKAGRVLKTFRFRPEQLKRLKEEAQNTKTTQTGILENALSEYLDV